MEKTRPISCRLDREAFMKVERIANERGFKVGTYLRKVTPFILKHPELLSMDSSILGEFELLVRNRNILSRTEGGSLTTSDLELDGFDFSRYTNFSVNGYKRRITVLDYMVYETSPNLFTVKRLSDGNV